MLLTKFSFIHPTGIGAGIYRNNLTTTMTTMKQLYAPYVSLYSYDQHPGSMHRQYTSSHCIEYVGYVVFVFYEEGVQPVPYQCPETIINANIYSDVVGDKFTMTRFNHDTAFFRFVSSQCETVLLCNDASHWLGVFVFFRQKPAL